MYTVHTRTTKAHTPACTTQPTPSSHTRTHQCAQHVLRLPAAMASVPGGVKYAVPSPANSHTALFSYSCHSLTLHVTLLSSPVGCRGVWGSVGGGGGVCCVLLVYTGVCGGTVHIFPLRHINTTHTHTSHHNHTHSMCPVQPPFMYNHHAHIPRCTMSSTCRPLSGNCRSQHTHEGSSGLGVDGNGRCQSVSMLGSPATCKPHPCWRVKR